MVIESQNDEPARINTAVYQSHNDFSERVNIENQSPSARNELSAVQIDQNSPISRNMTSPLEIGSSN